MRLHTIVMTVLTLCAVQARGEGDPASQLYNVRSLKCHFGPGTATEWTGSKSKVSNARNQIRDCGSASAANQLIPLGVGSERDRPYPHS
jgi:hypothetical protein